MKLPEYKTFSMPWILTTVIGVIIGNYLLFLGCNPISCIVIITIFYIITALIYKAIKNHEDIKEEVRELKKLREEIEENML